MFKLLQEINVLKKDITISWNDIKGFYHKDFNHQMFFVVLANVIKEYNLKVDSNLNSTSETEMYFSVKELNKGDFNINLLQEDGSEWIF